ncbi:carboxypeptidase regulatory-like domain-containing protein [Corallococcus terminator]
MRRWLGIGGGLLLLGVVLAWVLLGGLSVTGQERGKTAASGADAEGRRSSWASLLAAPVPAPRGEQVLRGVVIDVQGPVAGAVVVATEETPRMPLSALPCDDDGSSKLLLLDVDCPVQGLLDWLDSDEGAMPPLARAVTDSEGRFTLAGLEAGRYAVWAEGPRSVALGEDIAAGTEDLEMWLDEGPSLAGEVRDEYARPVAGVRVIALLTAHHRAFEVTTAPDGHFEFGDLPDQDYSVIFSKEGLLPVHKKPRGADLLAMDVTMSRARVLSGRVVHGDAPAPGAQVRCEGDDWSREVVADGEGRFTFEGLPPGRYSFSAKDGEAVAEEFVGLGSSGDYPEVVLMLGSDMLVEGVVRDARGAPIVGASVLATRMGVPSLPRAKHATSDARGTFSLGPVSRDPYMVKVDAPGFLEHMVVQRLGADREPLVFVLRDAFTVEGTVVDAEGHPLEGAHLTAVYPSDGRGPFDESLKGRDDLEVESSTTTGKDGAFVLSAEEAGERAIVVSHALHRSTWLSVTSPRKGLRVVLATGATVSGEVLFETDYPVRSAHVMLLARPRPPEGHHEKMVYTDAMGRFSLQGVAEGKYRLIVTVSEAASQRQLSKLLEVKGLAPVHEHLQFLAGRSLSGVVEDGEGKPLAGVLIRATPAVKNVSVRVRGADFAMHQGESTGRSDAGGRFELSDLVPGSYSLVARLNGHVLEVPPDSKPEGDHLPSVLVEAGSSELRLVMHREVGIRGRLVREDGTPITRFEVNGSSFTSPRGEFFQGPHGTGTWRLAFSAPGFAPLSMRVEAVEGQALDLGAVVLRPGRQVRGRVTDAATGRPVAGALVDLGDVPKDAEGWADEVMLDVQEVVARTNQDGTFTLPHVLEQPYALVVLHEAYSQKRLLLGAKQDEVAVALEVGALLRGTVGGPAADGTTVILSGSENGFVRELLVLSGQFEQAGVPPGSYLVTVRRDDIEDDGPPPGPRFLPQRIQVPASGTVTVDFLPP